MEPVLQERIATVSVSRSNQSEAASLYLVHFSHRQYVLYFCSACDDQLYDIIVTESRDEAVEAFKIWTGILVDHGKDYLLKQLKTLKE